MLEQALRSHLSLVENPTYARLSSLGKPELIYKRPLLFIYAPNEELLGSIQGILLPSYRLELFTSSTSLISAMRGTDAPVLTMMAWNSMDNSMDVLRQVLSKGYRQPVLLLSPSSDSEDVVCALQFGASGVIQEPFSGADLIAAVEKHLHRNISPANRDFLPEQTRLDDQYSFVRSSQQMRSIESQARLIARSDIPVLILGESGTGKEVLARYIHSMSKRSEKIYLKINCAAMPIDLLESELFGYEKGAFTGATQTKPGKFEICDGGTIFLDEIGELPTVLQAKLLQVLQDGTYLRLGGRLSHRSDVRVIAATNIDIKSSIAQKNFREDLYYRLNGFTLNLPPLRERKDEIAVFARYFMQNGSQKYGYQPQPLGPNLLSSLENHTWPGNLRELENVINRYLITGDTRFIVEELLPTPQLIPSGSSKEPELGHKARMRRLKGNAEAIAIRRMLEETKWNRKEAAKRMQVSYRTLLYKIRQYELTRL